MPPHEQLEQLADMQRQLAELERVYAERYRRLEKQLADYVRSEVARMQARVDAALVSSRRGDDAALQAVDRLWR